MRWMYSTILLCISITSSKDPTNIYSIKETSHIQSLRASKLARRILNQECPRFADANPKYEAIDTSASEIVGVEASIFVTYPDFIFDKTLDFSNRVTRFRYEEGQAIGGWDVKQNFNCTESLFQSFLYEDLKVAELVVIGNELFFWLDFTWYEIVNDGAFGEVTRDVHYDLPFKLQLPKYIALTVGLSQPPTIDPTKFPTIDPSVCPTYTPTFAPTQCPTLDPTVDPSIHPTQYPSFTPTLVPTQSPTVDPTDYPTITPTMHPTAYPSQNPTSTPTLTPTKAPTMDPTFTPTKSPSDDPTQYPTFTPTKCPSDDPTFDPTFDPSQDPTFSPTLTPTLHPSVDPTIHPTFTPTQNPTTEPTIDPSQDPTFTPTLTPTVDPTIDPTNAPTVNPTLDPSFDPTISPTVNPTQDPTLTPSITPSVDPTYTPTITPTVNPTIDPTVDPSFTPTQDPTLEPTIDPSLDPTLTPTVDPSVDPTVTPTINPTVDPTMDPSQDPTLTPTEEPTTDPTFTPTLNPTVDPTMDPSQDPTLTPTEEPTLDPTIAPTIEPSVDPTVDPSFDPTNNPTCTPTVSLTTAVTNPTATPTYTPTLMPTETPTRDPIVPTVCPTMSPSQSPTSNPTFNPTLDPTDTPTKTPTLDPTTCPTTTPTTSPSLAPSTPEPSFFPTAPPSQFPTYAPIEDVLTIWVVTAFAREINEEKQPWIDLQFTSAASTPWKLAVAELTSDYIADIISFNETDSYSCTVHGNDYTCQEFELKFHTVKECIDGTRDILVTFNASAKDVVETHTTDLPFTLSGSSAFECAKDLGAFQLSHQTELSTDGDNFFNNINTFYLNTDVWFRFYFSSGQTIASVDLVDLMIFTSQSTPEEICRNCDMLAPNLDFQIIDDAYTTWTAKMFMNSSVLEPSSYSIEFSFLVTYENRRRELYEARRSLSQKESTIATIVKMQYLDTPLSIPQKSKYEYELRFDYDCAMVSNPTNQSLFLDECSSLFFPVECLSLRCGSVIVKFRAPNAQAMVSMLNETESNQSIMLPSFGYAKTLAMSEVEERKTSSAGTLLLGSLFALAFVIGMCVLYRVRKPYAAPIQDHQQL